jgi:hypothetical protein
MNKLQIGISTLSLLAFACSSSVPSAELTANVSHETPIVSQYVRVCDSGGLNIRQEAGAGNAILRQVEDGQILEHVNNELQLVEGKSWYKVRYGKIIGWSNARFLCEIE